ncbi:MAG: right-handed parallel beta-helix repeat-containing protein [Anaerolineales bacterium]|nr:right-handed parallel beta-helix repeat-containing protein [Anaerolineales bacterium]
MKTRKHSVVLSILMFVVLLVSMGMPLTAGADEGSNPPKEINEPADPVADTDDEEDLSSASTILEEVPEGTDVVLLSEDGAVEPLTEETSEGVLAETDPFWCPDGAAPEPGSGGCTSSYATFTELLAYLDANDTDVGFQHDGTIFVTSGAYSSEPEITINGPTYGPMENYTLTLQGGWDAGTNTVPAGSTTSFDVPVTINWWGGVNVYDMTVHADDSDPSLILESNGDIALDNVTVSNDTGSGVGIIAAGDVNLTDVTATDSNIGAEVYVGGETSVTDSTFSDNGGGLYIESTGDVTLDNVTADDNGFGGAYIDTSGVLEILSSSFDRNVDGTGLEAYADGGVNITDSTFNQNGTALSAGDFGAGAKIESGGEMTLTDVTASGNQADGLALYAGWTAYLNNIIAIANGWNGVYISAGCHEVFVSDGEFSDNGTGINGGYGLEAYKPLEGVRFSGTQTYSGNVTGDFYEVVCVPCESCECEEDAGSYEAVEPGQIYPIPCDVNPADFKLASGDGALFFNLCGYSVKFEVYGLEELPAPLDTSGWPTEASFFSGMGISLYLDSESVDLLSEEGYFTISFKLPAGQAHRDYAILYWDPAMNEGSGGWLELPAYDLDPDGAPVVSELHDGMTVLSGVLLSPDGLRVQATVNFTGLFVLVRE